MARIIYNFELFSSPSNNQNYEYSGYGANSAIFTKGDPVTADSTNGMRGFSTAYAAIPAGQLAGVFGVYGIAAKTVTMASNNATVAKVQLPLYPMDQRYKWLAGTNGDLSGTAVGAFFGLTGSTGAYQVDVATGTVTAASAVVICVDTDPLSEGGTGAASGARQGVFQFVHVQSFMS